MISHDAEDSFVGTGAETQRVKKGDENMYYLMQPDDYNEV